MNSFWRLVTGRGCHGLWELQFSFSFFLRVKKGLKKINKSSDFLPFIHYTMTLLPEGNAISTINQPLFFMRLMYFEGLCNRHRDANWLQNLRTPQARPGPLNSPPTANQLILLNMQYECKLRERLQ